MFVEQGARGISEHRTGKRSIAESAKRRFKGMGNDQNTDIRYNTRNNRTDLDRLCVVCDEKARDPLAAGLRRITQLIEAITWILTQ